jgi:hypothetical protein
MTYYPSIRYWKTEELAEESLRLVRYVGERSAELLEQGIAVRWPWLEERHLELAEEARRRAQGGRCLMHVRCAWCGAELPSVECAPSEAGKRSDGLCAQCFDREIRRFGVDEAHA